MTSSIAHEVTRRRRAPGASYGRRGRPPHYVHSFAGDLASEIRRVIPIAAGLTWPCTQFQSEPVRFFREILGVEPWARQIDVIEAVRDHMRVAVASGHKVSKSHTAAGLALWFYCSFVDARVVMTSTTSRQVDQILWRELRMMRARGGRCTACLEADPDRTLTPRPCPHSSLITEEPGELARTGIKGADFREVVGFTAREAEAVAGVSGRNLLYVVDESSGVGDDIFQAIEGNRAGGARIVMFGNPTRNEGEFFNAFHSKAHLYRTLRISSEETPNVVAGRVVIPGLATREWIEEKRLEWGEDSPLYRVRVKGEHALREDGRIFSLHVISESEARWSETPEAGQLYIGCDAAGESGTGDDSAFAVRRGMKHLLLETDRGLNAEQHMVRLLALAERFRLPRETVVIVIDREGPIGLRLARLFAAELETAERAGRPLGIELVTVRASDRAFRQPTLFDRVRDELVANLEAWIRDGGAILEDTRLEGELHVFEWRQAQNGRLKATPKDAIKRELGRSPDRFDALALACFEPLSLVAGELPASAAALRANEARSAGGAELDAYDGAPGLDPYGGAFDPYRGGGGL